MAGFRSGFSKRASSASPALSERALRAIRDPGRAPVALLPLLAAFGTAWAAPGDPLFSETFNGNSSLVRWTAAGPGESILTSEFSQQGRALRLGGGQISLSSDPIDAAVPGARLEVWIGRGDDGVSDQPEAGEDLRVEYLDADGNWQLLDVFSGGGPGGETFTPAWDLPADALHASLSVRFEVTDGDNDGDYWYVDDAHLTETAAAAAQFTINHDGFGIHCAPETVMVSVIDPVSGTPRLDYDADVVLDTQNGAGSWTLVAGGGVLDDGTAGDGVASYDWPLGESQATFALTYRQGLPAVDVDVWQGSDSGIRDTDAEGLLVFSPSGFTLTAGPLANPPPSLIVPFAASQTAAVPFRVHITAYGQTPDDPVCGVIEGYTGNKDLTFWFGYVDPASGSRSYMIDGTAIPAAEAAAAPQLVAFTNGQASVTAKYKDVGSTQLFVKDATPADPDLLTGIRGGTADFVVRPERFVLSDIRDAGGSIVNPQAADADGPVFIAAGAPFRATVTALDAEGDPTPNYGREQIPESVQLVPQLVAPAGGANPAVNAAAGFENFSGGSATGVDFTWPEVGIVSLVPSVGDGDYLGSGDVGGPPSENVGRFLPDHFTTVLDPPTFATACTTGGYTYLGEPFEYRDPPVITATARAADGATTENYTGAFFKLSDTTIQNVSYAATSGTLDVSGLPSPDPVVAELTGQPGSSTLTFSSGSVSSGGGLKFDRGAPEAPFDAEISLSVDVLDADGVAADENPVTFGTSGGIAFDAGPEIRYGRVRIANALGSERIDLALPMLSEYFAGPGTGFVLNDSDGCTADVTLAYAAFTENLDPGETCVLDSGAPGASNAGCPTAAPPLSQFTEPPAAGSFNLWLAAPGDGNTGSVLLNASVPAWLRFDWDAAIPGDENPAGQAVFGLFPGSDRQIYIREVF